LAVALQGSQRAKGDESMRRFIPEHQRYAGKTLRQGEPADVRQFRVAAKDLRQPIKRNPAAKMVDVVNANIRREPP
jgi:hypothetical protein